MRQSNAWSTTAAAIAASVLLASLPAPVQAATSEVCQLHSSTYGRFDLRGLRSSSDYEVEDPKGEAIKLNFCGPLKTQVWAVSNPEAVGAYMEAPNGGISLGNFDNTPDLQRGVLSFKYEGGSACPNSSAKKASVIQLQCDSSWFSSNKLELVNVVDQCTYVFTMKTSAACALGWYSSIFSWIWSLIVWTFWIVALGSIGFFMYNTFGPGRRSGGQTLGGGNTNGLGAALGTVKDGLVVGGILILDGAQAIADKIKAGRGSGNSSYMPAHVDYSSWNRNGAGTGASQASGNYSQSAGVSAAQRAHNGGSRSQQPETNLPPGPKGMLEEDDEDDEEDLIAVERGEAKGPTALGNINAPQGRYRDQQ